MVRSLPIGEVVVEESPCQSGTWGVGDTAAAEVTQEVTFELDRRITVVSYRSGDTLLQTARTAGLKTPSLCETGSCGTCIARLTVGSACMLNNSVLSPDEVRDGYVLTCQAIPNAKVVRVVYE